MEGGPITAPLGAPGPQFHKEQAADHSAHDVQGAEAAIAPRNGARQPPRGLLPRGGRASSGRRREGERGGKSLGGEAGKRSTPGSGGCRGPAGKPGDGKGDNGSEAGMQQPQNSPRGIGSRLPL